MSLYEIDYALKENADSEFTYDRTYQIPAETEQDALIRLGQLHPEDRIIKLVKVRKVFGH